ncbi:MAG: Dabb family protein [Clostridium perfringens]|nr:Dabb family protein [Clostridium perfringens]
MVKHIVMWTLKEDKKDKALEIKNDLEGLKEKLSYIKFIKVGINFNTTDSAYDIVLNSDFETKEDLDKYQVSEEHLKVASKVREAVSKRAVVDYEY